MNSYSYNVPILSQELSPTETLTYLFTNLKYLDNVIDDIFNKLENRISYEHKKVKNISSRISNCQVQINKIQENHTKATTIHSIAKYPAPKILPNYPLTYSEFITHSLSLPSHVDSNISKEDLKIRGDRIDTSDLFIKLTDVTSKDHKYNIINNKLEGLGRLPTNLSSLSSILLFNTSDNPYKKYISLDNLEGIGGKDREKKTNEVAAAPQTLIDGDILPMFAGQDFGFKPKMGDVPTFALPSVLPDLPGIADISWSMDAKQSIAPSSVSILSLPSLDNFAFSHAPPPAPMKTTLAISSSSLPSASPPSAPPNAVSKLPAGPPIAGPPTGPPTGPLVSVPPPFVKEIVPKSDDVPESGRNALLDAIRNGKNLRNVSKLLESGEDVPPPAGVKPLATKDSDSEKPGKKSSAPPPMDMMSALAAKLKLRSKAISGKADDEDKPKPVSRRESAIYFPTPPKPDSLRRESSLPLPPKPEPNKNIANVDAYIASKENKIKPIDEEDDNDWE